MDAAIERRLFRRAELDVPVVMRLLAGEGSPAEPMTGHVTNVSLAGFFCHVQAPCPLKAGQQVVSSISIPREQARYFPFTRLHGKGWVVRLGALPAGRREGELPPEEGLIGLAVAFTPDVTALGTFGY